MQHPSLLTQARPNTCVMSFASCFVWLELTEINSALLGPGVHQGLIDIESSVAKIEIETEQLFIRLISLVCSIVSVSELLKLYYTIKPNKKF